MHTLYYSTRYSLPPHTCLCLHRLLLCPVAGGWCNAGPCRNPAKDCMTVSRYYYSAKYDGHPQIVRLRDFKGLPRDKAM